MKKQITFLSGGVGGARFARALDQWNKRQGSLHQLTAIVNVGDDFDHLGMRICPDLDSVTYHLANMGDTARGWGRSNDTSTAITEIQRILPEQGWFHLGDLDIAHNLIRTQLLARGFTLSSTTEFLCQKYGVETRILPVTNDPSPTHVLFDTGSDKPTQLSFQDWWVREKAEPLPDSFAFVNASTVSPAPGVLEAIHDADTLIIAPSNPAVSIAPILAVPGVREAIQTSPASVVGLSPIIAGQPVRGYADRCLAVLGVESTATAVAEYYGLRSDGGIIDAWLIDSADTHLQTSFTGRIDTAPIIFQQDRRDDWIIDSLLALAQ